jgi:hypothetical protein
MSLLPDTFSDLESFAPLWAIEGSAARAALRGDSTKEQRDEFFRAAEHRLREALEYLDSKTLADFDAADRTLMNLVLSYAHVALAVEVQGGDEAKHAKWRPRMVLTRTPAGV